MNILYYLTDIKDLKMTFGNQTLQFQKVGKNLKSWYSLKERSTSIVIAMRAIDGIALLLSGLLCFWITFSNLNISHDYRSIFLIGILLGMSLLSVNGAYRAWRGTPFRIEIKCVSKAIFISFLFLILSTFITQSSTLFSRIWMVSWPICACIIILSYRFILRTTLGRLRSKGWNIRQVLIIGNSKLAKEVANKLLQNPETGLVVQGFIYDKITQKNKIVTDCLPYLGTLNNLDKIVSQYHIDQVWIALPLHETKQMKKVQSALATTAVTIRMVPDIFGFQLLNHSITEVAGLPVINLSASHMIESKKRFLKSLEDKILSIIILICISPLLVIIAIAIKSTSSGPVIFKQYRTGNNGRNFKVYKFRTMIVHNESDGTVTQAKKGDSRITKIGNFLRKTSLDELPQFINVLQGRMSIVGPRPHALEHNEQYKTLVESYMRRHMVKPGITGWAQVNGFRGETDTINKMESRVEYDLYYIENWTIWFDLRIIFLTIFKGFIHKNAI